MSEPLRAGPLSDDVTSEDRNVIDEHGSASPYSSRRQLLRPRPQSWHPYGPVEPPLESASSRSIGVHAILNSPAQMTADLTPGNREQRSLPSPTSSPRPRQGSSPAPRSIHPLAQQPLSPRSRSRPMINPGSSRFVSAGDRHSAQSSVSHSPLAPHNPSMAGLRQLPAVSSPLMLDSSLRSIPSIPSTQPSSAAATQSTPVIHSQRASIGTGQLTSPNSQETPPATPHSGYSHYGHVSPAVPTTSMPSTPYSGAPTSYMTIDSMTRGIPATAGPRSRTEDTSTPGLIPCVLDLKTGSSSQAEKRKANSNASRRFRNRKRNEMQLEQRLNSQQDEIQRHLDTVRRQSEEIRSLTQQRDYYRSERDVFRDHLVHSMPLSQLAPRPPSPRSTGITPEISTESVPTLQPWATEDLRSTSVSQHLPAGSAPGHPGRLVDSPMPQGTWLPGPTVSGPGSLPPFGSWSRP
ncbi:hypothetical protein N7495_006843 [Penicillium taxi]|uniref:uncharacterized protein n=1 Tax=Penicillium taxi TaxID=168475 RepID=UPI0025457E25|nr:uncharacterized protein N7495_006843 [Penicillium taxi]KAJ5895152.1 hypothetical protein N7495_006843 [Penicillium taxi]